ncbi:hypothetical protein KKG36_01485 [Patescibacteria group bacterium]|nr:hypothetical protein [Patescibacteria group bacterium]
MAENIESRLGSEEPETPDQKKFREELGEMAEKARQEAAESPKQEGLDLAELTKKEKKDLKRWRSEQQKGEVETTPKDVLPENPDLKKLMTAVKKGVKRARREIAKNPKKGGLDLAEGEDAEKKWREAEREVSPEFIEALEKTPLGPENQVWILLTKAGLKPASWLDKDIKRTEHGKVTEFLKNEEVHQLVSFLEAFFPCVVEKKTVDIVKNRRGIWVGVPSEKGRKIGEEERLDFIIGSNKENLEKIVSALEAKDDRKIGLALGFEPTAVEAFCGKGKLVDNEKLPDEALFSEAFVFSPSRLSADNWLKELAQHQKWADYVKKTSPSLFNRMMGFQKEVKKEAK